MQVIFHDIIPLLEIFPETDLEKKKSMHEDDYFKNDHNRNTVIKTISSKSQGIVKWYYL